MAVRGDRGNERVVFEEELEAQQDNVLNAEAGQGREGRVVYSSDNIDPSRTFFAEPRVLNPGHVHDEEVKQEECHVISSCVPGGMGY